MNVELEMEKVFGKFILNCLKERSKWRYDMLFKRYKFYETLDNYVVCLDFHYPKATDILFYPNENLMPTEITEEIYVNYFVGNLIKFEAPLWITKVNNYYTLTNKCSRKSIRQLSSFEMKEIQKMTDMYNDQYIEKLKRYYKNYKSVITKFSLT